MKLFGRNPETGRIIIYNPFEKRKDTGTMPQRSRASQEYPTRESSLPAFHPGWENDPRFPDEAREQLRRIRRT